MVVVGVFVVVVTSMVPCSGFAEQQGTALPGRIPLLPLPVGWRFLGRRCCPEDVAFAVDAVVLNCHFHEEGMTRGPARQRPIRRSDNGRGDRAVAP